MANEGVKVFLDVKTSGGTSFKLNNFHGVERLSDFFEYNLLMTAKSRDVEFEALIGKPATISLTLGTLVRTYNGIVGKFEQDGTPFEQLDMYTVYRATIYPQLWLLTFSGQCRIFQNKSALEIIQEVLGESQILYFNRVLTSGRQQREFCVQYNETDYNFIARLMEEEGIFYFFEQRLDGHWLILADSIVEHPSCSHAETVSFHDVGPHEPFMMKVSSCFITQRIVPRSDTLKSYNYLTPQTELKSTSTGIFRGGEGENTSYHQIFDQQDYGDKLVKVKLQSQEVPQKMVEGVSLVPFFLAGYKFKLEKHPRADANREYVLYEVTHEARIIEGEAGPIYKNTYQAFHATIPFRPPQKTPKPRIYGTQTAKVTGKPGEEIYTEEYGRIKVKFHWDPSEKEDDTTSCWIRVATLWSGQAWGTLFTPRVGQEVVVSFIDGDPDQPLVIGSVYNGENKPPYLPNEPTKSTIKSQTSKKQEDATPGYNELRFEDKRESEEIYIHAQKDFNIDIQNDQNITIVGGNRTILLKAEQEQEEESGGLQSNDALTLMNGNKSLTIVQGNYSIQLDEGNITVTCSSGNVTFDAMGDISFTCSGLFNVDAAAGIFLQTGTEIKASAGGDVSVSAGGEASIKAGGMASVAAAADVSVRAGGALTLTATGSATVEAAMINLTGSVIELNG